MKLVDRNGITFLWDKWFKEFQYDPAKVAADGYRRCFFREWWRKIGPTITRKRISNDALA